MGDQRTTSWKSFLRFHLYKGSEGPLQVTKLARQGLYTLNNLLDLTKPLLKNKHNSRPFEPMLCEKIV